MSKFHSILFLLEIKNDCAKALYVATVQHDAVLVQCFWTESPLSPLLCLVLFVCFVFRGIPLGSVIVICCLRQSHRKSLGLLVPRLLDDVNVPYLVKNTPKTNNYPQNSR